MYGQTVVFIEFRGGRRGSKDTLPKKNWGENRQFSARATKEL